MLVVCGLLCFSVTAQTLEFEDSFSSAQVAPDRWTITVGTGQSYARVEATDGRRAVHLFGDHSSTSLATREPVPNVAYTLQYDFRQSAGETGGYQAVVRHARPEGYAYWWLEYGPDRFFLYTVAGGQWYNRWQAGGLPTNRWYHIEVRNTPVGVRIRIDDESGQKVLAESPLIQHDDGSPAPLMFDAAGTEKGVWGMEVGNVRLAVTAVEDRDDYQQRRAALEAARKALGAEETRRLWPGATDAISDADAAFAAIVKTPAQDWGGYVKANERFDAALRDLATRYHDEVIARLGKERAGWVMADLQTHYNADAALLGMSVPASGPVADVKGTPFCVAPFGRDCLWQDEPSRSGRSIPLRARARRIALLLAPKYEAELYGHDDSLVDVLQVELRYADGFRERISPVPSGWAPALPDGVGRPPMENRRTDAYVIDPGHNAELREVVLCDGATQAGWALMGLSYQPGTPEEVPVMEPVRAPAARPAEASPATATVTDEQVVIENPSARMVLDAKMGLLRAFSGPACGQMIRPDSPSPLFGVQINDRIAYSDEFLVEEVSTRQEAQGVVVTYALRGPGEGGPFEVTLAIEGSRSGAWTWRASVHNPGDQPVTGRLIFPLLDGLDLGERPGWYFPQRGGAASQLPFEGLSSYGGMAWLQLLDAYRAEGGGVYVRCDDEGADYKVLALRSSPDEQTKPRRCADIPEPAHPVDPWRAARGVHLSVQYLPREFTPGETWSPGATTVAVHAGDWHAALADYREWLKTWWKPIRPCPRRYWYGFYALVGGAPRDDQRGEEFGSYDWWHLSPFWSIDYPDDLGSQIDGLHKEGQRAAQWGEAVGVYIEGMCLERSHRIGQEHGAEWAMKDDKGDYYTYYSTEANPVWNMCPADEAWRQWDAAAYAEIARRTPLCAMYVDSTGSRWAEVCYNPDHHHNTPGIWPRGCAALFETIRRAVLQTSPETAIHSEEPGCDFMALHEDGSWSHSLWTAVSGDEEYNPAGLNYFRFALPEFKMYEIPSYRHALWRCKLAFFNGEGLWTNVPDALRRELFIRWFPTLREHADTFMSDDVEPAVPAVAPPLYMNAFRRGGQAIYTLYNAGLRTRTARVPLGLPEKGHAFDLLALDEVSVEASDGSARLTLDPHEVRCLLVTPRMLTAEVEGNALTVTLPAGSGGAKLMATLVDDEGVRRQTQEIAVPANATAARADLSKLFGDAQGRVLVRRSSEHATQDETCVRWRK